MRPGAQSSQPSTPPRMHLTLLKLNDDVLRLICNELFGKDALNLALTSRHLHDHAIRRVVAAFRTWDLAKLRRFHQHIIHGSRPRVHYLESLVIYWDTFCLDEESVAGDQHSSPEALRLLLDLLAGAHHLHRLSLDCLHLLLRRDPRLFPTLKALHHLHRAEFDTVADSAVQLIGQTGWDLHVLSLEYDDDRVINREHIEGESKSYPVLLKALANFPHLHTLKLGSFNPVESFRDIVPHTAPPLPSIRRLFLWAASPETLDITDLCPNVSLIDFELDFPDFDVELEPRPGQRWPPLRSLTFNSLHAAKCADLRLRSSYHLQIAMPINVMDPEREHVRNVRRLLNVLQRVSPVRAQLWMEVGAASMKFWSQVPTVAPRLRYLELKVSLGDIKEKYARWLDNIPEALSSLPLVFLRLHLPKHPPVDIWSTGGPQSTMATLAAVKACSQRLYENRVKTLSTFPQRLADAIPTLRLLALADEGPGLDYADSEDSDAENDDHQTGVGASALGGDAASREAQDFDDEDDDTYFREKDDYESQGGWYGEKLETLRWWEVTNVRGSREVRELATEDGKRIQDFLDDWSFDGIERIDEILPQWGGRCRPC